MLSILSTSTITGRAFTVPSAMAKSALLAMTKSLAVEWSPQGIRTVAIAPGSFPTKGAFEQLRPASRESFAARNPLSRGGKHRELAELASFLIRMQPPPSMARWSCSTAERICAPAEDLLQWSDAQWEKLGAARTKD